MKRLLFAGILLLLMIGTASADTLIFYPPSTDADGVMGENTNTATFYGLRNDVGDTLDLTTADTRGCLIRTRTSAPVWDYMTRFGATFNTSSIPDGATITSAKFGAYVTSKNTNLNASWSVGLSVFAPASNTTLVAGDYDSWGSSRIADDIPIGSIATAQYNNWSLTNLDIIDKTSYTRVMMRSSFDIDNVSPTYVATKDASVNIYDTSYGSLFPFLEITYTLPITAPVASFTADRVFTRIPHLITFTDTSTNTPTSWEWAWGDGSANSTTQNPTHQYTKRGAYNVYLTATNAGGSGSTGATVIRVVGYENAY